MAADQRTYVPAQADWKSTAADEADVRRIFESYYASRDSGEFKAALAMFNSKARPESAAWPDKIRLFNSALGAGKRRITGVTWYVNPPSAEVPGIYAAVDFVSDYPNVHFYCGYVVFYRLEPGSYEIVREEQNAFHRGDGDANPDHLAQMRAAACRGD